MSVKKRGSVIVLVVVTALSAVLAVSRLRGPTVLADGPAPEIMPADGTKQAQAPAHPLDFPMGAATPSEQCGVCHQAIYREFATGFGSDLKYKRMIYRSGDNKVLTLPAEISTSVTPHAAAGVDSFPIHARGAEEKGRSCNVCHFPEPFELPDLDLLKLLEPKARASEKEVGGLTCASCHLTPDGKMRGPFRVKATHQTVEDPKMKTSAMCAYCHAMGERVVGKQTQTFLEWREDFHKPGLGSQHCQDCHMPRTLRKSAEDFDVPVRAVARHLWTGGHSFQRVQSALSLASVQVDEGRPDLEFHVINIGAGHSVPTGSNRRAVYLVAEIHDGKELIASREWMFAPWFGNRPDDKAFLEEDKKSSEREAAMADAQGPHEAPIRAGESRILSWVPELKVGHYTVRSRLVYDLNRYNDRAFLDDQTEIYRSSLKLKIKADE